MMTHYGECRWATNFLWGKVGANGEKGIEDLHATQKSEIKQKGGISFFFQEKKNLRCC
jgi:hypothetical protein